LPEISISITGEETPMLLPNPPWYRRWKVILAGVIGLAAITALLGLRGLQELGPSEPGPTDLPPPTVVPTTAAAPPTSITRPQTTTTRAGVLWHKKGHDVDKSPGIRAQGAFRIEWSYDCSNFKKFGSGGFKITGDGAFDRVEIQAAELKASGRHTYPRGGFGHLSIDSVCDHWTVTVLDA
jgi:hypothetical protein